MESGFLKYYPEYCCTSHNNNALRPQALGNNLSSFEWEGLVL